MLRSRLSVQWAAAAVALLAIVASREAIAAEEGDEEDEMAQFAPGLVARYAAPDGRVCVRRDDVVQFAWGGDPPDERLPTGPFSAAWRGRLFTIAPGPYRLLVYLAGSATVRVSGERVLTAESDQPRWFESDPVELEYGYHPLEIHFEKTSDAARIGLFWSGPKFELEPLPAHALWHEPTDEPDDGFGRGGELWRALRCANCHRESVESRLSLRESSATFAERKAMMAPDLTRLAGNLSRRWLVDWLRRAGHRTDDKTAEPPRMPSFGLTDDEAQAIAAYLLAAPQTPASDTAALPLGEPKRGERLLLTIGCLACHSIDDIGSAGLFGGGDLARIADKRPADFFARWLEDPASINPAHRMPVFRLSPAERADLAAYLATLGADRPKPAAKEEPFAASLARRGEQLVEELRCGACHHLPKPSTAVKVAPARLEANDRNGCLGSPDRKRRRPGYELSTSDREALAAYLAARVSPPTLDGRFVLRERNCLGCHARDGSPGIAAKLPNLIEAHPELAPAMPALSPPSLTQVGDKLHDAALADAIALRGPPLRPWLAVRMPRFDLAPEELLALTRYLTTIDRIPDGAGEPAPGRFFRGAKDDKGPAHEAKSLAAAGSRLVTSTGFGCTSCHPIGHSQPAGVSLAAHGTDLSRMGRRIRRSWFDRWVHNPARIVPRIEMPAIQVPVPGVLGGRLDDQLAAVWHVLNLPGFEPPRAGPVRVARHEGGDGPAAVITDLVELPDRVFVRPLVIGLSNRHNVLFDLTSNQLTGWWLGDTARQQTRGKAWYWEPAGKNLLDGAGTVQGSGFRVQVDQRPIEPMANSGQALAELDRWEQIAGGVRFAYRLKFADGPRPLTLRVEEELSTAEHGLGQGFRRRWQIRGLPEHCTLRLRLSPAGEEFSESLGKIVARGKPSSITIAITSPPGTDVQRSDDGYHVSLNRPSAEEPIVCEAVYLTESIAEPAAAETPATSTPPTPLQVVPGYEAVRLPLPRDEMPTGLAWRSDGTLAFCSLKGGVWLARDTDGDGLEDRLQNFADGLPAPYGLAVYGDSLDVCAKYGVVRLADGDGDGRADRGEIVASGWGYTADYHDWTVGLPRDASGNYYVGLPCQQDARSADEAHLRGTAVKLVPRQPSPEDPRRYALEVVSAGLRFPMGLAVHRDGALFATDNQGNYTPFNELNHLVAGARYGFINKLEATADFHPAFEEPAVAIPHPWTRSVNGICFLYTPDAVRRERGGELFGPFEGQVLGCEYDTRRLIRMSLEKIGDTYQGAAYPFSVEPPAGAETFEGPVVCAVSPSGDLYIGNLRDSGWGGGQNTGSIVRLRPTGDPPPGIAEVRAERDGFSVRFTQPISPERARQAKHYSIASYRRIATPAYGAPDADRADETIVSVEPSSDARSVRLRLARLRPGFVYELRLANLAGAGGTFFPAEAYYTLRRIPRRSHP